MSPSIWKSDGRPIPKPGDTAPFEEAAVCEACGRFGAFRLGDHALSLECYVERGSCCPEFGKDDLWTFPNDELLPARRLNQPVKTKSSPVRPRLCDMRA